MSTQVVVEDIALAIEQAIKKEDWKRVNVEMENFLDFIAESISNKNTEVINAETIARVRGLHDNLYLVCKKSAQPKNIHQSFAFGELRTLLSLLLCAERRLKVETTPPRKNKVRLGKGYRVDSATSKKRQMQ